MNLKRVVTLGKTSPGHLISSSAIQPDSGLRVNQSEANAKLLNQSENQKLLPPIIKS